jgi:hypothetical protein
MATFEASKVRAVALELRERVIDIYAAVLPIVSSTDAWVLHGLDPSLPPPYNVKVQLALYQELAVSRLRLTDWITALQAAVPGDTLTYPPPPEQGLGVYFDETVVFDQNLIF